MRKLLALFLIGVIVFPLTLASLSLIAVGAWVLDRSFYQELLGNERLYEVLLSEELPNYFNRRVVREVDSLPATALSAALREVVTPQYLRDEATRLVDQAFDVLEGKGDRLYLYLDITPIKDALRGEGRTRFARTLAANLPACGAGQTALAPDGTLIRCLPADVSTEEAASLIATALPAFLDKTPDEIDLSRERIDLRRDLRGVNVLWSVQDALGLAIVVMVFITGSFWMVAALLAGEDRRERLMWLGWTLLVPALLMFLIGLAVNADSTAGWVRFGLNEARFGGFEYSLEFRQALLDVTRSALNTIANGFLATGAVAGAIALALVAWGTSTPPERYAMAPSPAPTPWATAPASPAAQTGQEAESPGSNA